MKVTITLDHDEADWLAFALARQLQSDKTQREQLRDKWEEAGGVNAEWSPDWEFISILSMEICICEGIQKQLTEARW